MNRSAPRFARLDPASMTEAQRRVAEAIVAKRGGDGTRGPFNLWLRAPDLAERLQQLGAYIRYGSGLPQRLVEYAICVTAIAWNAPYEWYAHAPLGVKAGLRPEDLRRLRDGEGPDPADAALSAVHAFATELHRDKRVSDPTLEAVRGLFGEGGVMELIATCGHYVTVSMTLNVAEVPIPDGEPFAIPAG
ncbi:MAG: carboxymuconolactone decarboxylase family protein [Acetobacteraceae bacterium]|nr:carboxymuconolactone decarboxylase family protein [Acetobacteraceae bacterium]